MANQQAWSTALGTLTLDTNQYSQYDVMGGLQTIAIPNGCGSGQIQVVQFFDDDNEKAAIDYYIFDALPSTIADDAAIGGLAITDLQILAVQKSIAAGDWKNAGAGSLAWVSSELSPVRPFFTTTGSIYMYVVCTGATGPTYTHANDLTYKIRMLLD